MKALRIVGILFLSLFIFSCASTPSDTSSEELESETTSEIVEETVEEILPEADATTDDEVTEIEEETAVADISNENTEELTDEIEEIDEIETIEDIEEVDILHQALEEIQEPEIIDLEPPLEELPVEQEPEIESEVIPDAEKEIEELPPVEIKLEEPKFSTEDDNDVIVVVDNDNTTAEEEVTVQEEDEVSVISEDSDEVECLDESDNSSEEVLEEEQVIIPSRSVSMKLMEYVDVIYPGKGWIFMGLTDNTKDLSYNGRQIGTENTKFSLQAKNAGTKILHFYKNDPVKEEFMDDYVEVIISKEKGSAKTHIAAPEYKAPLPKKQNPVVENPVVETKDEEENTVSSPVKETAPVQKKSEEPTTVIETPKTVVEAPKATLKAAPKVEQKKENPVKQEEVVEVIDTEKLYTEAKKDFDSKNYSDAVSKLNLFLEHSTTKRDDALYMLGQIYETPGASQNVQKSLDSYTTLINNYPASKHWNNANKRIIYLKRFYMEGR